MSENWKWWVGPSDERFTQECDTREEAVRIAQEEYEGGAHIVEAVKPGNIKLSSYFDAADFVSEADEQAYDNYGDPDGGDYIFDVGPEKIADLEAKVRASIDDWQTQHGLTFTSFQFSECRNAEFIPPKGEEVPADA